MPTLLERVRRRLLRPRLSLRATMIVVLIVGGGFGWIVHRARSQTEAVAEIERSGGHVRYDWQRHYSRSENRVIPDRPIPGWLMRNLGPDYFSDVNAAVLTDDPKTSSINEAFAARLGRLHRLEILRIPSGSSLDDAGMTQLSGLTRLQELDLRCSGVTGAGLVHLSEMRELRQLQLGSTPLRDEHLKPLSGLTKLWELTMTGDRLGDVGIAHLAPLTELKILWIRDGNPRLVKGGRPRTVSNPRGWRKSRASDWSSPVEGWNPSPGCMRCGISRSAPAGSRTWVRSGN